MKFLLILLAIILVIPSSAFAGTWTIRIDQIRPIINYMKRLHPQKQQNSVSHIIKVAVTPPMARVLSRAVKKTKPCHLMKPLTVKFKTKIINPSPEMVPVKTVKTEKTIHPPARIHGSTAGLPVLTVNFVKTPLWKALQTLSNKTGYMFTSRRVNLGADITLAGKYNLAALLNKLFAKDTVKIIQQTKKIQIEGK